MAMNGGSVSISGGGVASGSGLAKALYDALVATFGGIQAGAAGAPAKQQIADLANAIGPVVVAHIVANAQVTVTVVPADIGLQTSTPNGTPTGPPAGTMPLATKGTIA